MFNIALNTRSYNLELIRICNVMFNIALSRRSYKLEPIRIFNVICNIVLNMSYVLYVLLAQKGFLKRLGS